MLQGQHASRRRTLELRIVTEVRMFNAAFNTGMKMQILAAKYAVALIELGGFPEVVLELEQRGELSILILESGARRVYPGKAWMDSCWY